VDEATRRYFEKVKALGFEKLDEVRVVQEDISINRAILEIHGRFGQLQIRVKEIFDT